MQSQTHRVLRALARRGLDVSTNGQTWSVRWSSSPDAPPACALLPDGPRIDGRALSQLADLASVTHPHRGTVHAVCATPDLHPGSHVPVGAIVHSEDLVIPAAVGGDINCGMRMHLVDVSVDRLLSVRDPLVAALEGDYFFGTRDIVLPSQAARALYHDGLAGLLLALGGAPEGDLGRIDREVWFDELDRIAFGGGLPGHVDWVPAGLAPASGDVRDGGLATIGGGNHFVEIQVVHEVVDRAAAYRFGIRTGQIAILIHSGSRNVGRAIGGQWRDRARDHWPVGHRFPAGGLFPLADPEDIASYLTAQATAANYAFLNRALLAERVRLRLRSLLGDLSMPLVADVPHNLVFVNPDGTFVTRKGACPAEADQPVLIPGSMGTSSFLGIGRGSAPHLCSASHGAGRQHSRFEMGRAGAPSDLGLEGVDCVSLRPERRIEEAPAAYKPIRPVVDVQVEAGILDVVAELRPLLTFKG